MPKRMSASTALLFYMLTAVSAYGQEPLSTDRPVTWKEKYGDQYDLTYTGPRAFAHLPYIKCLEEESTTFDIAILGLPFDTGVSHRPGARFGPAGIRSGSQRQRKQRGYTLAWGNDPYSGPLKVIDCGDVPVTPYDNHMAMDQIQIAYSTLLSRPSTSSLKPPRIVSLGGDHTIVLPILRSLYKVHGPISVIHFDSHLDTWQGYGGSTPSADTVTHGTFFQIASNEGLVANNSVHAGIRCKLEGMGDISNDESVGFQIITTDDIDDLGIPEIVRRIRKRVGDSPVYLSLDIDVIDPGMAPATGTPEAGGWTTREVKRIIRGLAGLNFVGADIVEVAPAYDHAEITAIAAADLVHDFLSLFMSPSPPTPYKSTHVQGEL